MSLASHWEIIPTFPFLSHTCAAPHKTTTPGTPKRNGRALLVQPAIKRIQPGGNAALSWMQMG